MTALLGQHPLLVLAYIVLILFAGFSILGHIGIVFNDIRFYRLPSASGKLTRKSTSGDFIHFHGKVTFPTQEKTPFKGIECCYWASWVQAVFKTKKKKPDKGMISHTPTIHRASTESKPLIISDGNTVVNINVSRFPSVFINPSHTITEYPQPPSSELSKLAKPKYETYRVMEMWLPKDAYVFVLGKIEAINRHSVILCSGKEKNKPLFVFVGSIKEYKAFYMHRIRKTFFMISLLLIFFFISSLFMYASTNKAHISIVLGVSLFLAFMIDK